MTSKQRFALARLLDEEIFLLTIGCFRSASKHKWLYFTSSLLMLIYVIIILASLLIAVYFDRYNLIKLAENLSFSLIEILFLIKLMNFASKQRIFDRIEMFLNSHHLNDLDMNDQQILNSFIQPFEQFVRLFRICIVGTVIFFALFPYIDKNPNNLIPFPGWFPFSIETYRLWIILAQNVQMIIAALNDSTLDITMVKLVTIITAYVNILKETLKQTVVEGDQQLVKAKIKRCVSLHNILIEFAEAVENLFGNGIFFQFVFTVLIICCIEFQMIVTPIASAQFLLLFFYLSTVVCQVALYCWFGNELIFHSSGIPEACYMSDWLKYDKESRKMLLLIMERGKRPIAITAGKFFAISLPTLMTLLRTSYSYFAVLRRFYLK